MADKEISVLNPATNQYEPLKSSNNPEEESSVGNDKTPKGYVPEGANLAYNATNNPTQMPTPTEQAEKQAELNAIANQNQADSDQYNKVPTKPVEKPVKQYRNIDYKDLRKDVGSWNSSPNSYTGDYADLYSQFNDLNGWVSQLNSLDSTSNNTRNIIDNVPVHLQGALKLAKKSGMSPDEALHRLTAVAQAANNEDAQAGIDYFLTTGIAKNKAAAKYSDAVRNARTLLDNGEISEDQYKEALGNIAQEIVKNEKYFDRPANLNAVYDMLLEAGGYFAGAGLVKGLGKAGSAFANSKLGKKLFTETKIGKYFLNKGTKAELERLYNSLNKEVPISEADAKIIKACTPEDEAAFIRAYEEFKKIMPNGGDNEFLSYIKNLPSNTQKSISRTIAASDTIAKVNPEGFAYDMLDAYLGPDVTPEAAMNQYNFLVNRLKNRTEFTSAELARFLRANSAEQAGGLAGTAMGYLKGLTPDSDTTSGSVTGGKGAESIEPMPSRETAPVDQNNVDEVPDVNEAKYMSDDPALAEALERVKKAQEAYKNAGPKDKAAAKKALDEAINDYNLKLNAVENDITKEMPNKLRAMDNSQVNMRQFWKSSLGRSILDAYANGEITGGQALYFSIQALAEGILNASRGIATGIHGEGLQDMKPSTWDTLQKTRTSEAYSFRNQQLNQMANDQLNYVSEIFKLDADSQKKVRDLMSDAITRNYYNKLDDSRKLEFIELLAAYAPKYVRFNDDQKKVFRQIMMESGQITPDDINLMISQFGMSGIAGLIRQGKESMMRSEYWKSVSNKKEVEELEKKIDILESEGKIKSQEASMYKLKLYTEASKGGVGVLKEILGLVGNK